MRPKELAKLLEISERELFSYLVENKILNAGEDFPLSKEECTQVASFYINKLRLKVAKQKEIRDGLFNVFSFKNTERFWKFIDNLDS